MLPRDRVYGEKTSTLDGKAVQMECYNFVLRQFSLLSSESSSEILEGAMGS